MHHAFLNSELLARRRGPLYFNKRYTIIKSIIRKGGQGRRSDDAGSRSGWTERRAGDSGLRPDEKFED
jgi:hypothetical protein